MQCRLLTAKVSLKCVSPTIYSRLTDKCSLPRITEDLLQDEDDDDEEEEDILEADLPAGGDLMTVEGEIAAAEEEDEEEEEEEEEEYGGLRSAL